MIKRFLRTIGVMSVAALLVSCAGNADNKTVSDKQVTGVEHGVVDKVIMTVDAVPSTSDSDMEDNKSNVDVEAQAVEQTTLNGDVKVRITTTLGDITVVLYGDTPHHRDNFVKLAKEGFYDGTLFHRVINEFMIQAGDPESRNAPQGKMLGMGDPGYTIEAEIVYPRHFHGRGALAAARQGDATNPERRSSGSQFYIVTGKVYNQGQIAQLERQLNMSAQQDIFNRLATERRDTIMALRRSRDQAGLQALQEELIAMTEAEITARPVKLTAEQCEVYTTQGGAPHLDGQYSVFGHVVEGMEVVDAIQAVETDNNDRPRQDVAIVKMVVL